MLTGTTTEPGLTELSNRLETQDLIRAFRTMYLSRRIDDREILLKRQNKIYFQVSGAGHEAIQTAAGFAVRPGHDWFFLYYRDRALALSLGVTPEQMFLQATGAGSDPSSAGRQMPSHWSFPDLHIVSPSSATGTQLLPSVGCAQGGQMLDPATDAVTLVAIGEGATSEGEFWEAVNAASLESLPVIFLIEDNGFAISVPVEHQTPGGDISRLVSGHPNLRIFRCDGTDFAASYATMAEAVNYSRRERKPAFVHALCARL
jgi:2-oxoisovalerate dehydrogenase E1 component